MATGTGIQQGGGIQTSRATPDVNLSTGAAEAFDALANLGRTIEETVVDPYLEDVAAQKGAKEGREIAAGTREYKRPLISGNNVAKARADALESAYTAGVRNDMDAKLSTARRENAYDPEGYEKKSKEIVSGFIQGAPPRFAVDVENYGNARARSHLDVVANERMQRDQQEVALTLNAREQSLAADMEAMAANGQYGSDDFARAQAEYTGILYDKTHNPTIAFTPEQADAAHSRVMDAVQSAVVGREAVGAYTAAGGGPAGRLTAHRQLEEEFNATDGVFADLPPARKLSLYNAAKKTVDARYAVDAEEQKAKDAAERERAAVQRDTADEMRLQILTGGMTEAEVRASDLDPKYKNGLIATARTQVRSARSDARGEVLMAAAGKRAVVDAFRDDALAGTLDPGELADAVASGAILPGQARSLNTMRDKTLGPIVQGALKPFEDSAKSPLGALTVKPTTRAAAEQEAIAWARMNPNATWAQQQEAGAALAKKYFGGTDTGTGPAQVKAAASSVQGQLNAIEEKYRLKQITPKQRAEQRAALVAQMKK